MAKEIQHPPTLEVALTSTAIVHLLLRDVSEVEARNAEALTISREQGFVQRLSHNIIIEGWVLAHQGQAEVGISRMMEGISSYCATGAESWRPYWLTLLAESHSCADDYGQGMIVLSEALALVAQYGERYYESETLRLQGEFLLQQSPDNAAEAESCFHQAISIAQNQSAKSWELRAATSLARLWQSQGKRDEARELLAPVYGWFTEGFETADLIDAKTLLNELEGCRS